MIGDPAEDIGELGLRIDHPAFNDVISTTILPFYGSMSKVAAMRTAKHTLPPTRVDTSTIRQTGIRTLP